MLKELLSKGILSAGEELVWKRRVMKENHLAILNADGTITTADGKKHKTPSGAAKHLNGDKPVDGWLAWKVKSSGLSLSTLRKNT